MLEWGEDMSAFLKIIFGNAKKYLKKHFKLPFVFHFRLTIFWMHNSAKLNRINPFSTGKNVSSSF
jgi:hypothetical protein